MKLPLVVVFSISVGSNVFSQSFSSDTLPAVPSQAPHLPKHHFTIHLRQLVELEARLGYERTVGRRQAIGLQLDYKPNLEKMGLSMEIPGDHENETYLACTSYSLFVNYKYFIVKNPSSFFRPFVEAEVMGRYTTYNDQPSNSYSRKENVSNQTRNRGKTIYGNVLLAGSRFYLNTARSLFVDVYGGFGGRVTYVSQAGSDHKNENSIPDSIGSQLIIKNVLVEGKPQVGATFGVSF